MSFFTRTAKRAPRFIAICLLITLISTIGLASKWDSITNFATNFGTNPQTEADYKNLLPQSPTEFLSPGTCDTAGPIEIESSGGTLGGTPTAYGTLALAFTAINGGVLHLGTITIDVCGNTTETGTAGLNQVAGVTSITMSPAGGATRTISGAIAAGSPLINFNGADNVTIDGLNTGGNSLTISNTTIGTTAGTSTIRFIADATGNTINRTSILGSSTSTLATLAGTVLFSTGTTTGNDNNTISNCDIGPAGANLPSKAIMASGTSSTIENDNVQITGNNIFDFFNVAAVSTASTTGINILTGNEAWAISNNKFYQTATRTFTTTALRYAAITLNNTTGSFTVSGNAIGFGASNGTGTTTITGSSNEFRGIDIQNVAATAITSVQGNTISGITQTSSRASGTVGLSSFIGITMGVLADGTFGDGRINVGNITGNNIGSTDGSSTIVINETSSTASTAPVIGIYDFGSQANTISNNNIGSITIQSTGTVVGFRGIVFNTITGISETLNNNTIANITDTQVGSYAMFGIQGTAANLSATGNIIRNFTGASNTSGSIIMSGIIVSSSTGANTISQNTIHSLSNTSGAVANSIYAMSLSLPVAANVVTRNFIHSLSLTTTLTGSQIWGIAGGATGTTVYRNNMIRLGVNAAGSSVTLPSSIIGIRDSAGATNQFFHNTIYIGGTGVLATPTPSNTYCLFSDVITVTRAFQDNIFWNARSNVSGGTAHLAIRVGGTAANPAGLTSNYNVLYFSGTDGATGVFNGVVVPTLAAWRTATGQDANSFANDPMLIAPNGTAAAVDLHINPAATTVVEANGTLVASVTDDFDGQTRSTLTPVDIGADAGNFMGVDLAPPGITYTVLGNTSTTTNRTISATITDATGVASGANLPRIYFKKSTDASYVSTQCAFVSGTAQNGVYTCTIDYTLVGGGSVTGGNIIQYFVAAQDTVGNFTTNPAGGTGNVNSVTFGGTPNSYTITPSISGSKTVGAGGDYPTLTAAVAALNSAEITSPVTLTLTDASYTTPAETFPLTINANSGSSATNTVTIKPAVGVISSISGSASSCILNFNGADYMTLDGSNAIGGTSRDLTVTNTNAGASSAVVCVTSTGTGAGATNDTVKNTNLTGTTVTATAGTLFGVFSGSSTISITSAGPDNDNNTIQNNNVTKTQIGIYSGGASAANKNLGTVITQNVMNSASPTNITTGGVLASFEDGIQISRNDIAVLKHDGTTGTTNTAFGIALGLVPNNTVTIFTGSDVTNAQITRNRINGVTQLNSTGYSSFGIVINSVTSGTTLVANNMVSGVRSPATASDFSAGILAGGGTGSTTQIYFNSVSMSGARGAGTGFPSYGLAINSGNPIVDVRNNIFYNTQTGGTGKAYAIANGSTTFTNMTSSYNDLYVSGASTFVGQTGALGSGTDQATLAAWNTATGQDAAPLSKSVDPSFVNVLTDLHLTTSTTLESQGITIAGITVDFDGDTRPATPDIGADEITVSPGTIQFNSATYSVTEGTPTVTLTVTRTGGSGGAVTANYTLGGGTAVGGASCGAGIDYVNTGGSVNFASGDAADKTFNVTVCDDGLFETSETFDATLAIASGTATLGTPNPATVTITDNDVQPSLQFSTLGSVVNESTGTFAVTVTRTGAIENVVSVDYGTANGTATGGAACGAGIDFISASGTLNFASGVTSQTFNVTLCDDDLAESSEDFTASLSSPGGGAILGSPSTTTITINDFDPAPSFQFSSATYTNSDDIAKNTGKDDQFAPSASTITVTRTGATENVVSVNYATVGGTATAGASCTVGVDYITTSGTLNFASGVTSQTFNITVCTDALFEGDETVNLALSSPTAPAVLGTPDTAVLTITDNETVPTLQFSSATYTNSDDIAQFGVTTDEFAPSAATITVTRTGATDNAVSVDYATSNGTATGGVSCITGVDYITTSGTLNFALGETSKTFNVTVCTDALFEGNETVNLTLSSPTAPAALGTPNTAVLTIIDNDATPSLQFSSATYSVNEAGPTATITVTRTGAPDNAVAVNYGTIGGTASGGASCNPGIDYIATNGMLNFASGDLSKTFTVSICDDAVAESSETVNLALNNPTGGAVIGIQNTAVLTINDNDAADYSVTTTGNAIAVTDNKDSGDSVTISEPATGQIRFASGGKTFQIDGGAIITGDSGNLSLTSVTSIAFNGQGGNDMVDINGFTTALPNLTINGGTGDDTINFNGNISFATNANLDVDLQNDDAAPGIDSISVNSAAVLTMAGTGSATFKASRAVFVNGNGQVAVVDGNLTIEANQQATPSTGNFNGVAFNGGTLTTSGAGNIVVKGKGGSGTFSSLRGVFITGGSISSTSSAGGAGTITIDGTGGQGIGNNRGIEAVGAANAVTSVVGDISITGTGGAGTSTNNVGVQIQGSRVRSLGSAKITINGTGGSGTNANSGVRLLNLGAEVTSAGGDISITGNGGVTVTRSGNHGATVGFGAIVSATNGAKISLNGTAGGGTFGNAGVIISLADQTTTTAFSKVLSDSGDITITGNGGSGSGTGGGGNIGVNINSGGIVAATGTANLTINGTGGTCADVAASDCYGVDVESANTAGTGISTASGNLSITGIATAATGLNQNGIRFEDSVGATPVSITTGSGLLTLNATAGNSDPSSAALLFSDDTTMTLGGATNTFIADTMVIGSSQVTINAGANELRLRQQTNGVPIDLGGPDSPTMLGLTDGELDVITAGTLDIGNVASGNVYLTSDISRSSATVVNLVSGASVGAVSGSLDSGGGNIFAQPAAFTYASTSGVDFTTGASSTFKIASGQTLRLSIGAPVVDTGYEQLNVAGKVDISGVTLSLVAAAVPTGGETYRIINNDASDAITGTFTGLPEGTVISNFLGSGLSATITYLGGDGNDCVITVSGAPVLQFSSATGSVGEGGGSVTLTVTRTGSTANAISVDYATASGSATSGVSCAAGVDFINTNGTLNFGTGETSKTFNVAICNDNLFEGNEDFTATLTNPTGGAMIGSPATETVTITDNDTAPTFQFSSATYSTVENLTGLGSLPGATIIVTRSGATENAVSVNYATSNGTATGGASCAAGVDYLNTSGTLNFGSGATSLSFFVPTCPDTVFEGNETVNLALSSPTAPAILGTPSAAVLTIVENDSAPSVQFSAATYTEDESQTAGLTITRTGDTSGTTTVNFATSNGTATGGASCTPGVDYVSSNGAVTFNPGDTSQVVTVQLCSDLVAESTETINLTLSSPSSPALLGSPSAALLNINDTASQFRNNTAIGITNGTVTTASTINVSGAPATVGTLKVTLYDVNHTNSDDLDILLVGPQGQKFILMGDAGGANGLSSSATITFDDGALQVLPDNGVIATGKYEATNWVTPVTNFGSPAPNGPYIEPGNVVGGAPTLNSTFNGTNPNGVWSLYIRDDAGAFAPAGTGAVGGGWGIQFLAPTAANAEISGKVLTTNGAGIRNVNVVISGGNLTAPVTVQTGTFGNYRFSGLPVGENYVVTVVSRRYTFTNPTRVISLVDSITGEDFIAEP